MGHGSSRLVVTSWRWRPILVGAVFVGLIASPFVACEREEPKEERPPRIVIPIKKPQPLKATSPAKETKDQEKPVPPVERIESVTKRATAPQPPPPPALEKGIYRVKKGETLADIAGRREVYGDPLKWPSLFRLNMDRLDKATDPKSVPTASLKEGLALRFVTREEYAEKVKRLGGKPWVVNVLSSQEPERMYGPAVELMKLGYSAYITKGTVKGQEWLRLRVGFFGSREEAGEAGKAITARVATLKAWVVKIGEPEVEANGGY